MEAEHSYLERCYISFKKLVNGCIAIFVACSWSAWFLSVLEHWDAVEESSDTVKFFIASFWSVCLCAFTFAIFGNAQDQPKLTQIIRFAKTYSFRSSCILPKCAMTVGLLCKSSSASSSKTRWWRELGSFHKPSSASLAINFTYAFFSLKPCRCRPL